MATYRASGLADRQEKGSGEEERSRVERVVRLGGCDGAGCTGAVVGWRGSWMWMQMQLGPEAGKPGD